MHIYTRVQEELEKKAKPAMGLLHKLLRMIDEVSPVFKISNSFQYINSNIINYDSYYRRKVSHVYSSPVGCGGVSGDGALLLGACPEDAQHPRSPAHTTYIP